MAKFISRLVQAGATARAIEFGLITALIAVVSVSAITTLGVTVFQMAEAAAKPAQ